MRVSGLCFTQCLNVICDLVVYLVWGLLFFDLVFGNSVGDFDSFLLIF